MTSTELLHYVDFMVPQGQGNGKRVSVMITDMVGVTTSSCSGGKHLNWDSEDQKKVCLEAGKKVEIIQLHCYCCYYFNYVFVLWEEKF